LVLELLFAIVVALAVGLGTAYYAVEHGQLVDSMRIGGWVASPNAGTPDADPYSAAAFAKTGEIALGTGVGIAFVAESDSTGAALAGNCDYTVAGMTPPARLWTLTALDGTWHPTAAKSGRRGFFSGDVLREESGRFSITVSRVAHDGNWLPIGETNRLRLVMRLYDSPITSGSSLVELEMPTITRGTCL